MMHFNIRPLERFRGTSASIRRPKEIGHFSYDEKHQYHPDERSLRYYYPPRLGADLSKGFDSFQELDDSIDDHLDSLLKGLVDLESKTNVKCEADIITWRGMMTKVMTCPFDTFNGFEMNATKFEDTIFIEESHDYKLESRQSQHNRPAQPGAPSQELMAYWGYKFEALSLIPGPWDTVSREYIEGREDMIVNNYSQYCSIVKTGVGPTKIILGGEVDAIWDCRPDRMDDPINWVELKTSAEIESDKDVTKYERKLLKTWAQSFLLGVPKVVVGFRSKTGILLRLEELETKRIPGLVSKQGHSTWDGNLCINFTASFLDWLKSTIQKDGVWRIRRKEKSPVIEVFRIEESGHGDVLSNEFLSWRERMRDLHSPCLTSVDHDLAKSS